MTGIDTKAIQAELDSLVNPPDDPGRPTSNSKVVVKLDKSIWGKINIREGDTGYTISLNPCKIHIPGQLEAQVQVAREIITGG